MNYEELADRIHAIEMTVEKAHEDLSALLVAVEKMEKDEKAAKTFVEAKAAEKPAAEPKPVKLEAVRAVLTTLSSNKGASAVKALLAEFDAMKLSEIAAQDYPELLAKAEELAND